MYDSTLNQWVDDKSEGAGKRELLRGLKLALAVMLVGAIYSGNLIYALAIGPQMDSPRSTRATLVVVAPSAVDALDVAQSVVKELSWKSSG